MVSVALLRPERMRTLDLFDYIRHLDANGQTAQRYEIEFWRKVFYPLSCLVMIVLALPFAYLHFRQAGITTYMFGGVMIGISFFLLNNVFGYLGNLGNWWPWITAAAPGLIYSVMSLGAFTWLVLQALATGTAMQTPLGIVLFAHGSRDERWRAPVEAVARQVAALDPTARVACAYLELVAPDLRTAAQALVAAGARRIRIVPLFLGMGRHVREDLPGLVDELAGPPSGHRVLAAPGRRRRPRGDRPAGAAKHSNPELAVIFID